MQRIKVNLKERAYHILIGQDIFKKTGLILRRIGLSANAYIITNARIKNKYGRILSKSLKLNGFSFKFKLIADSEKSKSLKTAYAVLRDLTVYGAKKQIFIIALGGGVVGDLAGFCASIYKRGVAYVQIPTTLLSQADSSIGGKTAVDLHQGKNLIGTFYQPKLVLSDVGLLNSLKAKQIKDGLAEVIKYAVIKDPGLFSYLEKNIARILNKEKNSLEFIVTRSSRIKAKIIEQDEEEKKGLRTMLNFGHTLGHAIETAGGYKKYSHGQAIALGILVASQISCLLGLLDPAGLKRIEALLKKAGLPIKIEKIKLSKIIQAHYLDKKFIGAKNRFVLAQAIGKCKIKENIPLEVIKKAAKKYFLKAH